MSEEDLFGREEREVVAAPEEDAPLAMRFTPETLDDFVGQDHLLGPGRLLRRLIEADRLFSAIFFGPSGTGKTALARYIARKTSAAVVEMNAVTCGVADLRREIQKAKERRRMKQRTLLLLDEIHHFNRTQQDALLPDVERGNILLLGLTTENPYFYVNAALLSRTQVFEFAPLSEEATAVLLRRARSAEKGISGAVEVSEEAILHWARACGGDARRALTALEVAAKTTPPGADGKIRIGLEEAKASIQANLLVHDKTGDFHYDCLSAFIKSMRGSDPDAALYWMVRLLEAGEDPRVIARRLLIHAAEDVGNADPRALSVAAAAAEAVERAGPPECRIPLAQACLYIACAPKSNACYEALRAAEEEVKHGRPRQVPLHLRDSHLDADTRGHGKGYLYPHDFPGHHVKQAYWEEPKVFYEPSDQGFEKEIRERLNQWRRDTRGA